MKIMCSCVTMIRKTEQRSTKERLCNASDFIGDIEFPSGMTFTERRALVVYQRNKRRIVKGDLYIRQFNKMDGEVYEWICKKDIYDIIVKYDLMPEC